MRATSALYACCRNNRRIILPVVVIGIWSIKAITRGYSWAERRVFSGIAQVGGRPVVAYWLGTAKAPDLVRANIVVYFAASALITFVSYVVARLLTTRLIGLALIVGPVYGLGLWVGSHMFGLVSEATFRRICYGLIAAAGLFSLPVLDGVIR